MSYFILAQSNITARSLSALLKLLGEKVVEDPENDERCAVMDSQKISLGGGIEAYEQIVAWLDSKIESYSTNGSGIVTVLVDAVSPTDLNAVSRSMNWDTMIALLILTFPDVRWIFGVVIESNQDFPHPHHSFATLVNSLKRSPLFDPSGLRQWVRIVINQKLTSEHGKNPGKPMQLPMRKMLAVAIDDERDFAMIHAYASYRYGFRADIISSWGLMEQQFTSDKNQYHNGTHGYDLIMEDMRLAFPDKPGAKKLSSLLERGVACDLLAQDKDNSKWRFLITSGQSGKDDSLTEENEDFLELKRNGRGDILYKPIGGICDLWKATGLLKEFKEDTDDNPRGNASEFFWPPRELDDNEYHGHAAPGKLGMVAATLVKRAKAAKAQADGAEDYLVAALLASEAAELLSGKTPDLTLTALQIKHECEVRAECSFIGTGFHFELEQRFKEIALEVNNVSQWSKEPKKKAVDARATIVKTLREVYAEAGQMEEEDRCLVEFRKLNRIMSRPDRWWKHLLIVPWIAQLILAYGEWLLSSFSWLLTMIVVWALISIRCRGMVVVDGKTNTNWDSPAKALSSFFGAGPDAVSGWLEFLISFGIVSVGVFHIGILMSYLYSLVSRK